MKDLEILISKNGRYMMLEDTIYDYALNRHAKVNELSLSELIDIVGENMTFLAKDVKTDLKEISSFARKTAYHVVECFTETDDKLSLMMEYEVKFGSSLLTESVVNPEKLVLETWGWIKEQALILEYWGEEYVNKAVGAVKSAGNWVADKAKSAGTAIVNTAKSVGNSVVSGAKAVGNFIAHPIESLKKAWNWIKENGLAGVMNAVRDALYSGVGTAAQIFVSMIPGAGQVAMAILWGIFLIYDLYEGFANGKWDYLNIIFDVMGIIFAGGVKLLRGALKGVNVAGKSMAGTVETLAANPATKGFMGKIASGFSTVIGWLKKGATWLAEKLGLTKIAKWASQGEAWLSENILKPIGNGLGLKNIGNKTLSKTAGSPTVGQAARQSTISATKQKTVINPTIEKGAEKGVELYYANKANRLAAQAPVAAPKTVAPNNYGLDDDLSSAIDNLAVG
jgi:hypothetical protein